MRKQTLVKLLMIIALLVAVFFVSMALIEKENSVCMGVEIKGTGFLDDYKEGTKFDVSNLKFNGSTVAADERFEKIYISQPESALSSSSLLRGTLTSEDGSELYFINDQPLREIEEAVKNSMPLTLAVIKDGLYRKVKVFITTLPVMRLEGRVAYKNEDNRNVSIGEMTLFAGCDPYNNSYTVTNSELEWHVRGGSSTNDTKRPQKLNLKKNGEISDENLLGLGSDDDYILNPMNRDDTDIREKFLMDFWNKYFESAEGNFNMSTGEYVEVIINGEYMGLYLLQRRIDRKYLELDKDKDILIKGKPTWEADTVEQAYEIIYSPYTSEETYEILSTCLWSLRSGSFFDIENFIDLSLFFNYSVITDNSGFKNMFYVLKSDGENYSVSLVPWDVDISLGVTWKKDNFAYDYDQSMNTIAGRMEYDRVKGYVHYLELEKGEENFEKRLEKRWYELRENVFTSDNIESILDEYQKLLEKSGAKIRDKQTNGYYYGGEDTFKRLKDFAVLRIFKLDEFYHY